METTTTKDQDSNLISSQPANPRSYPPQLQSKTLQNTDIQATEPLTIVSLIATLLQFIAGCFVFNEFIKSDEWNTKKLMTGTPEKDWKILLFLIFPLITFVVLICYCKDLVEMASASAIQLAISQSVLLISTFVFALALCCHRLSKEKEGLLSSMARAASNCCHTLGNILWIRLRVPIWISLLCSIWSIVILSRKQSYV
jgi:hypothetical protein